METPFTTHLSIADFENVYEPAEDTFLLLDALELDLDFLDQQQPHICLEIGSGSGVIIAALAKRLCSTFCIATDINPYACSATKLTASFNMSKLRDVINCNLADALRSQTVDVVIFNPPYVVTNDNELNSKNCILNLSWAGGTNGRCVIDKLLSVISNIITPSGVMYLLLLRENNPDEVTRTLIDLGFKCTFLMERHVPGELLYVLKASRN